MNPQVGDRIVNSSSGEVYTVTSVVPWRVEAGMYDREEFKVGDIVIEGGLDPHEHNLWGVRKILLGSPHDSLVLRHVCRPPWCSWERDKTVEARDVEHVPEMVAIARLCTDRADLADP
jgi:hypothetical protein